MRNQDGSVQAGDEDPRLFQNLYVLELHGRLHSGNHARGKFTLRCLTASIPMGWPPLGSLPECYCAICSKLPAAGTPAYWRVFTDRVFELWQKYDAIAKEKKPDSFFFANLGGNVRGGPISIASEKSRHGSRPTTRGARTTLLPSGDAACRAASAMLCWTENLQ